MKKVLAALIAFSAVSAHAYFLESHYGKITRRGFVYTCHFKNRTNHTLDMKYLEFSFLRIGGHGDNEFSVKERVDTRVQPGETISHSVRPNYVQTVYFCRYWSR